jgi:hypothetical protein
MCEGFCDMSEQRYPTEVLDGEEDDGTMPSNVGELAKTVIGHRIVSAEMTDKLPEPERWGRRDGLLLTLDDGRQVVLRNSDDCCAYTEIQEFLLHPERVDHIITGVGTTEGYSRWHIYADMGDVLELTVGWSAGNPFYYGYGFEIEVVSPHESEFGDRCLTSICTHSCRSGAAPLVVTTAGRTRRPTGPT